MHLWPTIRLRESFKENYLKKLGWNLNQMNAEKRRRQGNQSNCSQQKLLETEKSDAESESSGCGGISVVLSEIFMMLSCCYCCFCCGACIVDDESS